MARLEDARGKGLILSSAWSTSWQHRPSTRIGPLC